MEIIKGSTKYYPSLPYRRLNIHLPFGWILFFHKDVGSCDIQLYNSNRQLDLVWWHRYNTLYGMAWICVIFGITIESVIAKLASKGVSDEVSKVRW